MKKKDILLIMTIALILSGCANSAKEISKENFKEATNEPADIVEESNSDETSAENLLDLFIDGKVVANYIETDREPFYITDLPYDEEDFNSYTIGDRVDLDNDGEEELIINGPYGGMYLDVRAEQVYVLDEGWGAAGTLSYTEFDGQTWIVHSDVMHGGRDIYDFTLYNGDGSVVDEFRLSKEYWEKPDEPDGPGTVYTYRDEKLPRKNMNS